MLLWVLSESCAEKRSCVSIRLWKLVKAQLRIWTAFDKTVDCWLQASYVKWWVGQCSAVRCEAKDRQLLQLNVRGMWNKMRCETARETTLVIDVNCTKQQKYWRPSKIQTTEASWVEGMLGKAMLSNVRFQMGLLQMCSGSLYQPPVSVPKFEMCYVEIHDTWTRMQSLEVKCKCYFYKN